MKSKEERREIYYEQNFKDNDIEHNAVEDLILKYVKKDPILDVGCGNGNLMLALKKDFEVEGIDISELAIQRSKRKGLKCFQREIATFYPTKKYKTILVIGVLAQLVDVKRDFEIIKNWLDDNGEMIIATPNASSPFFKRHEVHNKVFKYFQFANFIKENGLEIKKVIGCGRLRWFPLLSSVNLYILTKPPRPYS